ncbi:hypothetical protein CI610_01401 [invertebrate metagenome]|uniref:Yip1 domain-containing protein n=1 Tax=invertebrate metagenome TaxID=1711999 RepID=A0A2H9T8Q8_9ZZZZ
MIGELVRKFMKDFNDDADFTTTLTPDDISAKRNAMIAYIFMVVGLFTGFFWLIGAVWAMIQKGNARNSIFYDHYCNITSLFWWGLLFSIIGGILTIVLVGYLILAIVWLWSLWRIIKGMKHLTENQP